MSSTSGAVIAISGCQAELGQHRGHVLTRQPGLRETADAPASGCRLHQAYRLPAITSDRAVSAALSALTRSHPVLRTHLTADGDQATLQVTVQIQLLVDGKWVQKFKRDPDAQSPTGGVSSSVNDLAKWLRLQLANGKFDGKQIVDEKSLAETHHPQIRTGFNPFTQLPTFYGLGWNVSYDPEGRLRLNHSGAFGLGAATYVNLVPGEQLGVVVLTNAYPLGIAEALGTTFLDIALYGKPKQDWFPLYKQVYSNPAAVGTVLGFDYSKPPPSSAPALKNSAYVGRYTNDYFGDISIVEKDPGLAIVQGPKNKTFPMKHYDRDTFTYETEGENAVGRSGVTFTIGPDGEAEQVAVENLNVRGEGTFKRVRDQH